MLPEERFADAVAAVLGGKLPAYDAWLFDYCGSLARPGEPRRYLRYRADLLRFARCDPRGKVILEPGCGFGLGLVAFRLLGAGRACGLDLHGPMIETIEAYLPLLDRDISTAIEVAEADASAMPYDDASFDIVVANESISHYADVEGFIDEAHRVLRRGGVLVVFDSGNRRNPLTRRWARDVWRASELGGGPGTHPRAEPYRRRRAEILAATFDEPRREMIEELAARTYGMNRDELLEAARRYDETGELPPCPAAGGPPVDPDTGIVMERLFDPFELARAIDGHGFRTRVAGYWGGAGGSKAVRLANAGLSALSRVMMPTAKAYRIAARKL
jgi:ubiquinone/menaquinone biosynthesis C-methylase UbiE